MPRLFLALEIPASIKQGLLRVQAPIAGARWQTESQLHLTLLFLGNVHEETVPGVCDALRAIPLAGFELQVRGVGCFGRPQAPRNLWAGVHPEAPLAALHTRSKERLVHLGFAFEQRPFRPHITLARFKKTPGSVQALLADHGDDSFGAFAVDEFALLQSTQGRSGSAYTVVERFALANSLDGSDVPHQR